MPLLWSSTPFLRMTGVTPLDVADLHLKEKHQTNEPSQRSPCFVSASGGCVVAVGFFHLFVTNVKKFLGTLSFCKMVCFVFLALTLFWSLTYTFNIQRQAVFKQTSVNCLFLSFLYKAKQKISKIQISLYVAWWKNSTSSSCHPIAFDFGW